MASTDLRASDESSQKTETRFNPAAADSVDVLLENGLLESIKRSCFAANKASEYPRLVRRPL